MKYDKPALTYVEQLARLKQRGMQVGDEPRALHYLAHLNYYRLAAYWLPFEEDHDSHRFRQGACFETILDHYLFDRELRLLLLDAIERVEVSVRGHFAYQIGRRHGAHSLLQSNLFKDSGRWCYRNGLAGLLRDVQNNREIFIKHFRDQYEEPLPPIWAVVEIMSFGQLSKWMDHLAHREDRNAISRVYGLDERLLISFLHHLSVVRNHCAHHARLWNRELAVKFVLPRDPKELGESLVSLPGESRQRRLYNTLTMLAYLLDCISRNHHFRQRLAELMERYAIDVGWMGFPEDWQNRPLWSH
ncbi:ABC transporter permease [Litchfieldella qijiaojingensis]|uniref:ABC transporter permease n=1 Tax=Litchfieldella qijiaojingensis TaxID=980347 RepID=A0ABQ2Z1G9_9GAMM|nr:Abi family protein [Halomonas qijiaojingensis]GGY01884.1 ABC transporter permease [Halomonas qijiaojingensis]